eukprot:47715-Eustigmatos_ZCMA.PRE.1
MYATSSYEDAKLGTICCHRYFGYVDSKEGTNGGHGTHVSGSLAGYPANLASTSLAYSYSGNAYKAKVRKCVVPRSTLMMKFMMEGQGAIC